MFPKHYYHPHTIKLRNIIEITKKIYVFNIIFIDNQNDSQSDYNFKNYITVRNDQCVPNMPFYNF